MAKILIEPEIRIPPEAEAQIAQLKSSFNQAADSAKKVGSAAKTSGDDSTAAARQQMGILAQVRQRLEGLKKQREQAFDTTEIKRLNAELAATEAQLKKLESLGQGKSPIASFLGGATDFIKANVAIQSFQELAGVLGQGFEAAIRTEQFEQALATMLGSTEAAQERIASLVDFAAKTPFQMPAIEDATKRLLAFGISNDELMGTLKQLGDVAALTGTDFAALATMFGQIRATQVAYTGDLNQFANAGIPIYAQLAQQLNTTEAGVKQLASTGAISFEIINEAFRQMTSEGGKFAGGMEQQSQTLGGVLSTLKDNFSLLLMQAVQPLVPAIKSLAAGLIELIGFIIRLGTSLAAIPATVRENRTAILLLLGGLVALNLELVKSTGLFLLQQVRTKALAIAYGVKAAAIKGVTVAQNGLNTAMRANPIGLVIGLVTTLAGIFALLYDRFWQVRVGLEAFWAGLKEAGAIALEVVTGPFRGLARAVGGLIEVFQGNFTEGFKEMGEGIADALGRNVIKALEGVGRVGKAAGEAWNKAYADELKKGAPKAIVNEINKGTQAAQKQATTVLEGTGKAHAAKARYIKQLEYERQVIQSTTEAIKQQTEAIAKQAIEEGRNREIATANVGPLGATMLKIEEDRKRAISEAEESRMKAAKALEEQETRAIEALTQQRLRAEETVKKIRFEGGDQRELQMNLQFIASYEEEVKKVQQDVSRERLEIERAYLTNLQAIEQSTFIKRRVEADKFLKEQQEALRQGAVEAAEISRQLTAAVYLAVEDSQVRQVGIFNLFDMALQEEAERVRKAKVELEQIATQLQTGGLTETETEALIERQLVLEQVIETSYLRREKIDKDYNARLVEEARRTMEEKVALVEKEEQRFANLVSQTMQLIARSDGLSELAGRYESALHEIANVRRKFEETAAAQAIEINRQSLKQQIEDMEAAGIEMLMIKEKTQAEMTAEEVQALHRYRVLMMEREAVDRKYDAAKKEFNAQQLQSTIDLAQKTLMAITQTIRQVIDLQIQAVDRNIRAQEQAVSEAERIAESGNTRQLALERDRLEKLQQERAKFVRQQQALALIELIANSAVAVAKAAAQGGVAAPITIAATLLALAVGLAQARAQAQAAASGGFKRGGYTGDKPNDAVAGVVHGREFVVHAKAVEANRPVLEAINRGAVFRPLKQEIKERIVFKDDVRKWTRQDPLIVQQALRLDTLERELRGVRDGLREIVEVVEAIPETKFTLDEQGLSKTVVRNSNRDRFRRNRL